MIDDERLSEVISSSRPQDSLIGDTLDKRPCQRQTKSPLLSMRSQIRRVVPGLLAGFITFSIAKVGSTTRRANNFTAFTIIAVIDTI